LGPATGLAMLRFAALTTGARPHPSRLGPRTTTSHPAASTRSLHCNQHLPACHGKQPLALALACPCACQWRRSTEPVGEPTKATGLNVAIDLRSASCSIDGLVGDLEKESWKFT
jgi:hypothetical protein